MLYQLSVVLHVLCACVWVGGLLFFVLVLGPLVRRMEAATAAQTLRLVGGRFRVVGWSSLALLATTGVVNLLTRWTPLDGLFSEALWTSSFGTALSYKLGFFLLILLSSALHDVLGTKAARLLRERPDSPQALRMRRQASWLGRFSAAFALAVVTLAVLMTRGGF